MGIPTRDAAQPHHRAGTRSSFQSRVGIDGDSYEEGLGYYWYTAVPESGFQSRVGIDGDSYRGGWSTIWGNPGFSPVSGLMGIPTPGMMSGGRCVFRFSPVSGLMGIPTDRFGGIRGRPVRFSPVSGLMGIPTSFGIQRTPESIGVMIVSVPCRD